MLSRLLRKWSPGLLRPIVRALLRARITPNQLTLAALALAVVAGALIASGQLLASGLVLLLSGALDALDGELARESKSDTPYGALLDSVADHYGDFAVYMGIAWTALEARDQTTALLTLVAMFGSLVGSHIRARGGLIGLDTQDVGLFTRAERIIVLVVGLVGGLLSPAVALLAVGNNLSALQRLAYLAASAAKRGH
jgi:CDP-diacylglycerol---glycerol-3-phosphate 3-phosphatidyltransferase